MNGHTKSNFLGDVLLGRYRIVRELAKGGMGVVYLARAEGAVGFVKPYVIKLVLPEHADNERFISMFVREANILSNLRHPGVVSVIELGEREEDHALVMVLEYVRGYHLGQWAKYVRLKKRTIPIEIVVQLMIEVLDALHYAHSMVHPDGTPMGIVHRDISPSNILLDEDGRARLLDFGVARMRGGDQDYHTQVKGFVGKLMYSAPELLAEVDATAQSDLYSCAVVLHEMLIGRNVFRGDNQAATLNRVLNHQPELIEPLRRDVPQGLDAALQKALAKAPKDRFATAQDFASALRELQYEPENEVRARLAALLKVDFGQEMAELLGIESLADRDEAWRRLSHSPSLRPGSPLSTEQTVPAEGARAAITNRPRGPQSTLRGMPIDLTAVRVPRGKHESGRISSVSIIPPNPPSLSPHGDASGGRGAEAPRSMRPATSEMPTHAPPPPRTMRTLRAFVAGLAVAGALVSGVVFLLQREPAANATTRIPPIRVVTQQANETAPDVVDEEPVDAKQDGAVASRSPDPSGTSRPHGGRRERASKPDPASLTRAFRKQQSKIEACFAAHAVGVEGLPMMQLEFDLASSGSLEEVRVVPAELAMTPLGRCLKRVAATTQFPPQTRALSFAIPITASRAEASR